MNTMYRDILLSKIHKWVSGMQLRGGPRGLDPYLFPQKVKSALFFENLETFHCMFKLIVLKIFITLESMEILKLSVRFLCF